MNTIAYILGTIAALVALGSIVTIFKAEKKYNKYIAELRAMADALRASNREIRELHFRDPNGHLQVIKIIIDYGITDEEIDNKISTDWVRTDSPIPNRINEFVFSPKAIQNMRANGVEPEDVVRDMLIASGRMRP